LSSPCCFFAPTVSAAYQALRRKIARELAEGVAADYGSDPTNRDLSHFAGWSWLVGSGGLQHLLVKRMHVEEAAGSTSAPSM
jgi:hypothetical protein